MSNSRDKMEKVLKPTLIHNAKIYVSGESDYNWMKFVPRTGAITGMGRGDPPQPSNAADSPAVVVDAEGKRIFPGFHDAHIHAASVGQLNFMIRLYGCESVTMMQNKLREFIQSNPDLKWIIGRGWNQDVLGRFPTKEDIDLVCNDKPVVLKRVCGHVWCVNSKALELAGIDVKFPDPVGGQIDRFPEGHPHVGQPTGILRENAMGVVEKHVESSPQEHFQWITSGLTQCLRNGLTAVHSNEGNLWREYKHLAYENRLPIRVFLALYFVDRDESNFPKANEKAGSMLSCDRVKIFSDGALGPQTAAMSMPYIGGDKKGLLLHPPEKLQSLVKEAHSRGFRLEVHAIGDRAADEVVKAFALAGIGPERRPLLTHCQFLRDDIVERMVAQGVVANIQPQFLPTDAAWVTNVVPPELHRWGYAWKSLLQKGVVCSGGSDSPVEEPNPMLGIYDCIFRPSSADQRDPSVLKTYGPEECLTVQEAVDLYTKWGAYATLRENDLGELKEGYQADFVVIDSEKDPVEHPEAFLTAKIAQVWVKGTKKDLEVDYSMLQ